MARLNLQNLTFKQIIVKIIKFFFYAHVTMFVLVGLMCLYMIPFNPPIASIQLYRANFNPSKISKPTSIEMEEIPKIFIHDLLNAEDGHFYDHWGFDYAAIQRAQELNEQLGYRAYGASTISQQLARTLFLFPNKTYFRKYLELLISVEMDLILSKDRILELYLTYAEWGTDIYGIKDASRHYYKKPFGKISADQRMKLVTILASPIKYNPNNFYKNRLLRKRYNNVVRWH
jgi:monofunctional biosynthetic peptidoglycan transglycosylase